MRSLRVNRQSTSRLATVGALLLATVLQAALPAFVAADQVTERSIALSSSSKEAEGVEYTVSFKTGDTGSGAFVLDFCTDTPIIGQACTAPTGFDASGATSSTGGFTATGSTSQVVVVGTMAAASTITVVLADIDNPSEAGTVYARILTFADGTAAGNYESETPGTYIDEGGVALSITDTVGVSGAVLETLTFCAASAAITKDCGNADSNPPVLRLGETIGDTVALTPDAISTGDIFTQISTNAVNGATVSLKTSADCGGLKRAEATVCDIAPAIDEGITAGQAKFGLIAEAAADTGDVNSPSRGDFVAATGYDDTTYFIDWVTGNLTGVGSVYGSEVLNTNNAPAQHKNMKLTFGASISNDTPAGLYSTDISLIATGKF